MAGFLITLNFVAIEFVCFHCTGSMTPIPSRFGQISALTSFICHAWWPAGSAVPCLTTVDTHDFAWSRQKAQPLNVAVRNLIAVAWLAGFLIQLPFVKIPSWSMPVPTSDILKTFRSYMV